MYRVLEAILLTPRYSLRFNNRPNNVQLQWSVTARKRLRCLGLSLLDAGRPINAMRSTVRTSQCRSTTWIRLESVIENRRN